MNTKYLTSQLNAFIQELVECDLERHVEDMIICKTGVIFKFKYGTPKSLIKIIQVLYKNRIVISLTDGKWQIVFH